MTIKTSVNEQQEIKTAHSAPKTSVNEQQEIKTAHSAPKTSVNEQQGLNRFLINTRPPGPSNCRNDTTTLYFQGRRGQQKSRHPCIYMNAGCLNNVNILKLMTLDICQASSHHERMHSPAASLSTMTVTSSCF